MDKNEILAQETSNNGLTINLYYDAMAGVYLAFGMSAYYTTMVTNPFMSYSEEMQMPVAMLRREHILYLRQSLTKMDHACKSFYRFQLRTPIGDAGYERWARNVKSRQNVLRPIQ